MVAVRPQLATDRGVHRGSPRVSTAPSRPSVLPPPALLPACPLVNRATEARPGPPRHVLRLEAEKSKTSQKTALHFPKDFEMTYDFHDRGNFANPRQAPLRPGQRCGRRGGDQTWVAVCIQIRVRVSVGGRRLLLIWTEDI